MYKHYFSDITLPIQDACQLKYRSKKSKLFIRLQKKISLSVGYNSDVAFFFFFLQQVIFYLSQPVCWSKTYRDVMPVNTQVGYKRVTSKHSALCVLLLLHVSGDNVF